MTTAGISSDQAAQDANLLLRQATGWDRAALIVRAYEALSEAAETAYEELLDRRVRREPASQIVGVREFWGLDFEVTRDVLTPRPETELLVQATLDLCAQRPGDAPSPIIADVGTGSGCIAIAIATELPHAHLIASDISLAALTVARRNAARHGVGQRIAFLNRSLMPESDFDIVVSNPPYIPRRVGPALPPEVRDYEPSVALFGGEDGLDIYRGLLADHQALSGNGWLILEVGYDQGDTLRALAASRAWPDSESRWWEPGRSYHDLQGIERVLTFQARADFSSVRETP